MKNTPAALIITGLLTAALTGCTAGTTTLPGTAPSTNTSDAAAAVATSGISDKLKDAAKKALQGLSDKLGNGSAASDSPAGVAAPESLAVLETLPIKGRAPKTGYTREQFGAAWTDVDHNGCDTRNDVLQRDLTGETFKAGSKNCVVESGTLQDPYTGKTIAFKRGADSSAVQIDHMIPLSLAWQTGAQQLSVDQRLAFANDPINLMAVDGPANMQKSDGDAATWLPSNKSFRCTYVAKQIAVRAKYNLWVTQPEHDAMTKVLGSCAA